MSDARPAMSPQARAELDAWIAEQHKHFVPSDLDPVIDVIRKSDRLKAMAAAREAA
ncbi:hypothetical protein [Nocardia beijingensis]|uniref:hypothetical protein n=1 Tax=Nocardia beijingensis TaxID=95162 RepID=UPI0033A969E6